MPLVLMPLVLVLVLVLVDVLVVLVLSRSCTSNAHGQVGAVAEQQEAVVSARPRQHAASLLRSPRRWKVKKEFASFLRLLHKSNR